MDSPPVTYVTQTKVASYRIVHTEFIFIASNLRQAINKSDVKYDLRTITYFATIT